MTSLSLVCIATDEGVFNHNYNMENHLPNQPAGVQLKITTYPMGIQPKKIK